MTGPLLEARDLQKRFGGVWALHSLDLKQMEGETLGMIGPNGSGKTTLVNAVTGHVALDGGTIHFGERKISGLRPHEIARLGLHRTYQSLRVYNELSVRENLRIAILTIDGATDLRGGAVPELLSWLKLDNRVEAQASSLTLFEQRRLELAMRLVLAPRLIMLDEPVSGLSTLEIREMMRLLRDLKQRCTIFVIEHTMHVIRELADRVIVMLSGEKIADGRPEDILRDERVITHYLGAAHAQH